MQSDTPKVLHEIAGAPLFEHALMSAHALTGRRVVVVGHGGDAVAAAAQSVDPDIDYYGTGFDPFALNEPGFSHCRYQDICLVDLLRKVSRFAMTDPWRTVFCQKLQHHRATYDV